MTVESSSTASRFRSRASDMDARASKKSPARIAILLPNTRLTLGSPRRVSALSMTSSWKRLAVWIISVISARRRCRSSMPPQAAATSSTIVGRIFLPPSSSKKYCAHACSTGWSEPRRCLMPSPNDVMWPDTSAKGSASRVAAAVAVSSPFGSRRSDDFSSMPPSVPSTVGLSTPSTSSNASDSRCKASMALSSELLATCLAT
mmetsp:Transcript_31148/g.98875  ORF Transcript_31148/g.98875 Transcript_31148/m.98875 type:complete len:203 (-) Transcript_31148:282-890(-)